LASLVPKPKVNLTRFHGVFVGVPHHLNSKHRILVTPARRGKGGRKAIGQDKTPEERRSAMTGFCSGTPDRCKTGIHAIHSNNLGSPKVGPMRGRLKRVFTKSRRFRRHRSERGPVETCTHCGGPAKVIPKAFAALTGQALANTSDRCIEDQQLIDKILSHLKKKDRLPSLPNALPETRAPPHQQ
jgi:hypothetical protein